MSRPSIDSGPFVRIVVDAKTPLEAAETNDDAVRKQRLAHHARRVRDHMTQLGRKSSQEQFDATAFKSCRSANATVRHMLH
jgi:DNA anti-recombination protein RmuC